MNPLQQNPPVYAVSVLYHCDKVDRLFASLFAIWLMEIDRMISAFHLPFSYINRGYNSSLIQFFLWSLCTLGGMLYKCGTSFHKAIVTYCSIGFCHLDITKKYEGLK